MQCPIHKTEMYYSPAHHMYACQSPDCELRNGVRFHVNRNQFEPITQLRAVTHVNGRTHAVADHIHGGIEDDELALKTWRNMAEPGLLERLAMLVRATPPSKD